MPNPNFKTLPPLKELNEMLSYNPDTGEFFWKERPRHHFYQDDQHVRWNKVHAFRQAGGVKKKGYLVITIHRSAYKAHRLAWYMHTGEHPDLPLDHINHNRSDNRIINIRVASFSANAKNKSINCRNKSGCPGVKFYEKYGHWKASIKVDGKEVHLGCFKDRPDAISARRSAEERFGFHLNHGKERSPYIGVK